MFLVNIFAYNLKYSIDRSGSMFENVNSLEDMLFQLPPEMSKIIRWTLMNTDKLEQLNEQGSGNLLDNATETIIDKAVNTISFVLSPFIICCIIACVLTYIGVKIYAEYKVSQRPTLNNSSLCPLGTYISSYYYNYGEINSANIRDDVDKIYARCLKKYDAPELLEQRKQEIMADRMKEKLINYSKIIIFLTVFIFFLLVGLGGIYIGIELKGFVMTFTVCYIAKQIGPFVFPYKTDSYEFLKVQEFKKIIETYELEKIKQLQA